MKFPPRVWIDPSEFNSQNIHATIYANPQLDQVEYLSKDRHNELLKEAVRKAKIEAYEHAARGRCECLGRYRDGYSHLKIESHEPFCLTRVILEMAANYQKENVS